jgi:hypothetical protein
MLYHVLFNGDHIGPITPERGFQQGCHLSPYLYILCAKGLFTLIKHDQFTRKIHRICICRQAPPISHLPFADFNFLFCKANTMEANYLQDILFSYEAESGQAINFSKSTVAFGKNTSH